MCLARRAWVRHAFVPLIQRTKQSGWESLGPKQKHVKQEQMKNSTILLHRMWTLTFPILHFKTYTRDAFCFVFCFAACHTIPNKPNPTEMFQSVQLIVCHLHLGDYSLEDVEHFMTYSFVMMLHYLALQRLPLQSSCRILLTHNACWC